MQLIHAVLMKKIHITKRDLFYTDVKLFVDQSESDGVLDDVATMIGCTRSNLHVVASDKGLVVGRIYFEEDGDPIDCTRMGVGGKAIPPYIDKIENIKSDAEFILLVEKEAAYMRMAVRFGRVYRVDGTSGNRDNNSPRIKSCLTFILLACLIDFMLFSCMDRKIGFITSIPALSLPPRVNPMLPLACFWLALPMN
jgi:hypothetical protein